MHAVHWIQRRTRRAVARFRTAANHHTAVTALQPDENRASALDGATALSRGSPLSQWARPAGEIRREMAVSLTHCLPVISAIAAAMTAPGKTRQHGKRISSMACRIPSSSTTAVSAPSTAGRRRRTTARALASARRFHIIMRARRGVSSIPPFPRESDTDLFEQRGTPGRKPKQHSAVPFRSFTMIGWPRQIDHAR